jgi:hypothetical protein
MKRILAENAMARQMAAHAVSLALLLSAVVRPAWFAWPAGLALLLSNLWLLVNLWRCLQVYRRHLRHIGEQLAAAA